MLVRCLKLLKPYSQKGVPDDDDDDDEDEEDEGGTRRRAFPPCGRIMEKDVLSQAYHIGAFHHPFFQHTADSEPGHLNKPIDLCFVYAPF